MKNCTFELQEILDRTNDWLKFAEAKNGALLALNCAIIFGLSQTLSNMTAPPEALRMFALQAIGCLSAGVVFGTTTLIARLTPPWWIKFPNPGTSTNILFFGDICAHNSNSFLTEYYSTTGAQSTFSKIDLQYASQIVTNSKIAFIKFKQFNVAATLTICAFLTPVGCWLYYKVKQ